MSDETMKNGFVKLDELQKKLKEAIATYRMHVRMERVDLMAEDDAAYREAESAWRARLKELYPRRDSVAGHKEETAEDAARVNRDKLRDQLETMQTEFTSEPEREEQIEECTEYNGNYIVNIYRYGKRVKSYKTDAFEVDRDIPLKEMVEVRVRPVWGGWFREYTTLLGDNVVILDAETSDIVFRLDQNEDTLLIDVLGHAGEKVGRVCFMDGVTCECRHSESLQTYEVEMRREYADMYQRYKMPDEVYQHTLHKISALYALGNISQHGYVYLKKESRKLRNKAREEWEVEGRKKSRRGNEMHRLTEKDEQGNWALKGVTWKSLYTGAVITEETRQRLYGALCKLRDYEDSGLSPDEVEDMKDLIETHDEKERYKKESVCMVTKQNGEGPFTTVEHKKAKKRMEKQHDDSAHE